MAKIFITGDRSASPVYIPLVAIEMMRAQAAGKQIVTGDQQTGVESLVRDMAERAGIEIDVFEMFTSSDRPTADDWDSRHSLIASWDCEVVVIHADPHASSIVKSLFRTMDDNAVRLVGLADLMA